ncbi:transposase [Streptomyces sp. NPDC051896]|uniref:transposase n=1 Tax=Streptomyces sp. NPDC051896 TaxID=3155416 RepID=UPI003432C4A4
MHYPPSPSSPSWSTPSRESPPGCYARSTNAHVRRYLWGGHFWSGSYFTGSCAGAPLTVVKQYIENQKRPVG